jgi:hypothetical protein
VTDAYLGHLWRGVASCARVDETAGTLYFEVLESMNDASSSKEVSGADTRCESPVQKKSVEAQKPVLTRGLVLNGRKLLVSAFVDHEKCSIRLRSVDLNSMAQLDLVVCDSEWEDHIAPHLSDLPLGSSEEERYQQIVEELVQSLVLTSKGTLALSKPRAKAGGSADAASVENEVLMPVFTGRVYINGRLLSVNVHEDNFRQRLIFEVTFNQGADSRTELCWLKWKACVAWGGVEWKQSFSASKKRSLAGRLCEDLRIGHSGALYLQSAKSDGEIYLDSTEERESSSSSFLSSSSSSVVQPRVRPSSHPLLRCGVTCPDGSMLLVSAHDDRKTDGLLITALQPSTLTHLQGRYTPTGWSAMTHREKEAAAWQRCAKLSVATTTIPSRRRQRPSDHGSLSGESSSQAGSSHTSSPSRSTVCSSGSGSGGGGGGCDKGGGGSYFGGEEEEEEAALPSTPKPGEMKAGSMTPSIPSVVFSAAVSGRVLLCRFFFLDDEPRTILLKAFDPIRVVEHSVTTESASVEAALAVSNLTEASAEKREATLKRLCAFATLAANGDLVFDFTSKL